MHSKGTKRAAASSPSAQNRPVHGSYTWHHLHDHSSSLPPIPRAPCWYKMTPGCVDYSQCPVRTFAQMHSLHVNSGIRNETNYWFQLRALLKHGNSMDWSITVLSGFMISCCRFCTTYEIHGQCMWFGNLSYFPAALNAIPSSCGTTEQEWPK